MLKITLPLVALPAFAWGIANSISYGSAIGAWGTILFALSAIWLVYNVFAQPQGINKFKIFLRNGVFLLGVYFAVTLIGYGLESLSNSVSMLYIPVYLWLILGIIGFAIRSFILAIKNRSDAQLCSAHVVKGILSSGLLVGAVWFAWLSSDVGGYQTGCLNPFLPLTDPQSKIKRAM